MDACQGRIDRQISRVLPLLRCARELHAVDD